jgi:hypothetical protein
MSAAKHTPTPWTADGFDVECGLTTICTTYPDAHGIEPYGVDNNQIAEANAAHIVRCVNSHAALVAALEHIASMDDESDEWDGAARYHRVRGIAADALKAAKGEPSC